MNLLSIVCKNIWQQKLRSALTILGVGISIAAFVSLSGLTNNLETSLQSAYKARGTDLIVMEKATLDIFSSTIDQNYSALLKKLPHIQQSTPVLFYFYAVQHKQYFLIYGLEPDSYLFKTFNISGESIKDPNDAIVGAVAAKRLKRSVGDHFNIRGQEFTIRGIFKSTSILEESSIIVPLDTLQKIKKTPGKVTAINLRIDYTDAQIANANERKDLSQRVINSIDVDFRDLEVKDVQEFISTPFTVIFGFTWAISMVAFIIVILGIVNTMSTAVLERKKEIGILMAIGWRKSRILSLVLFESAIFGLLGGVVGVIIGYAMTRALIAVPAVQGFVSMSPDIFFILRSLGISMLVGILAGIHPAIKAVNIQPIEVLRYE